MTIFNQRTRIFQIGLILLLLLGTTLPARAAGLLVSKGQFGGNLDIVSQDVVVTVNNNIAVTDVTQVFHNNENRQVEALYTFPVPKGASVSNFSMWINGKEMVGEVVEKQRAREIYNSYKRQRRDPGLLEQVDYKIFEMRIFPIAANADQRIQITYYQELDIDHDWATYVYPLATTTTEAIESKTTGSFSLRLDVKSEIPIASIESPSNQDDFVFQNYSDTHTQASLEIPKGSLSQDVVLAYNLSRAKTGMDLITSKESDDDGYFYLSLTVGKDLAKLDKGMDYIFVLDISGSMSSENKLNLSKDALGSFIDGLDERDRFELLSFNLSPTPLFKKLQHADDNKKNEGLTFLQAQRAKGSTELAPAMSLAYQYADDTRQLNVVILSDGMTENKEQKILLDLINRRPENTRVFCIGVGNEVNRPLLEQIAQESGGLAAFLSQQDNIKRQAQAFRRKLTHPVASNLQLDFGDIDVYDLEPAILPDLYYGQPVRVFGRYRNNGKTTVTVSATIGKTGVKLADSFEFPDIDDKNSPIERMWAWHRIDRLQKDGNKQGNQALHQSKIIQLATTYSIVTEYSSFLVLENDNEYKRWKIARRNLARRKRDQVNSDALIEQLQSMRKSTLKTLNPNTTKDKQKSPELTINDPVAKKSIQNSPFVVNKAPAKTNNTTPRVRQQPRSSRPRGGRGGGVGPIGPLFLGIAALLRRKKKKKGSE